MGTNWGFKCTNGQCSQRKGWWDHTTMFEMLKKRAENSDYPECNCGHHSDIHFTFEFGFHGKVVGAFLPDDINDWHEGKGEDRKHWEFYPFLVVIESLKKNEPGQVIWQPYWHRVTAKDKSVRTLYGQWATCLDIDLFQQLLKKAKKYLPADNGEKTGHRDRGPGMDGGYVD